MKTKVSLTDKLEKLLESKPIKPSDKNNANLSSVFEVLAKHGLLAKSEYTLPLKDTIGKTYFDKIQFVD